MTNNRIKTLKTCEVCGLKKLHAEFLRNSRAYHNACIECETERDGLKVPPRTTGAMGGTYKPEPWVRRAGSEVAFGIKSKGLSV